MGIKVKLYSNPITGKRRSWFLDFYPPIMNTKTGKLTRRQFLGLYTLEKPTNPIEKESNAEIKKIAEQIRQRRDNELNKPEIYSEYEKQQLLAKERGEQNFVSYFESMAKKRKSSTYDNWNSCLHYLKDFTGGKLKFSELSIAKLGDFKHHLLTVKKRKRKGTLSPNSAHSYFNKIKACLRQAYKEGMLQQDLNAQVGAIPGEETQRVFLTLAEMNALAKTKCKNELLKIAALFSSLTGLAFADIQKMKWDELEYVKGQGYFLKYRRKKTKRIDMLPIPEQAYSLLGEQSIGTELVFKGLNYSAYQNELLKKWVSDAGITKKITFHNFRHSYATIQLALGTDITVIQKMLLHENIKTTMIYAKALDQSKRDAADKIKLDL